MIEVKNDVFHLRGDGWSCLLRADRYGRLQQLHFGAAVEDGDADALTVSPGSGWGCDVRTVDSDPASCPDITPLCWSGSGRGDYRESPLDVGFSTEPRYESYTVHRGGVPMEGPLPQAHGVEETLEVTLAQPGLTAKLYFGVTGPALTRRTVLVNTGSRPVTLHKCMSFLMDLPGELEMTTFDGWWIAEMRRHTTPVTAHRSVNESTTGNSSNRHNPGFLLSEPGCAEGWGRAYGINLIYSGNHYASAQRSHQGLTRVMQGVSPDHFSLELAPGEKFETPEAVLVFSDAGFDGMSRRMHRFVSDHIIPPYWRERERPVLYNSWEGCVFDFDHGRLMGLAEAAEKAGCELFVLDDGWFGKRNDDYAGLGDYDVNKKKLPHGLDGLANDLKRYGLQFGLWVEPESVNQDSDLYRAHPDWALTDETFPDAPLLGRHQLLLDLTRPEVRDYIVDNLSRLLDTVSISYIKWDMNRNSTALGAKAHQYILGLCDVLRRVFGPRPQVLLESCASGGNRFDLGMLSFGPQVWCSDDTDPIERLTIQQGLSYLYPQSTFGAHVSAAPHAQTLRDTPLETRGNVSFFGCLGYELDWKRLTRADREQIAGQVAFYKRHRKLFQFGQFHRLANGWQVCGNGTSIAGVFRGQTPASPGYEQLRLRGLEQDKRYRLTRQAQTPSDDTAALSASGAALMSGVWLTPLFRGTDFGSDRCAPADFGSELYLIEPED